LNGGLHAVSMEKPSEDVKFLGRSVYKNRISVFHTSLICGDVVIRSLWTGGGGGCVYLLWRFELWKLVAISVGDAMLFCFR